MNMMLAYWHDPDKTLDFSQILEQLNVRLTTHKKCDFSRVRLTLTNSFDLYE